FLCFWRESALWLFCLEGKSVTAKRLSFCPFAPLREENSWHARCQMRPRTSMFRERKIDHENCRFVCAGGRHVIRCGDSRFAVRLGECQRQARQGILAPSSSQAPSPQVPQKQIELL